MMHEVLRPSGEFRWRETHDRFQFTPARELTSDELAGLTQRRLFKGLLSFLQDEQRPDLLARRASGGKGKLLLGASSQQLAVPPGLLLAGMDSHIPLRFTVMDFGYTSKTVEADNNYGNFKILVNPKVTAISERTHLGIEGCKSFPADSEGTRISGIVARPESATIDALTSTDGETFVQERLFLPPSLAQLYSHEEGHLDGKAFGDGAERVLVVPTAKKEEYNVAIEVARAADAWQTFQWDLELTPQQYQQYMGAVKAGTRARILDYI